MMDDPDDWHTWLAANPAPSLQALAEKYGGAGNVPESVWAQFDQARRDWDAKRLERLTASYAGLKRRL